MTLAPTTDYIVDVTTADKPDLMDALIEVAGILTVYGGGVYRGITRTAKYTLRH
jgi:hypothetical protein